MVTFPRLVAESIRRSKKSVLLLGPRQTGKSTLMRAMRPDLEINLAREATFFELAQNPRALEEQLAASRPKTVFLDEVQRLPRVLNTVQAILDEPSPPRFLLTGSSARKLRRGRANLLPGRVHTYGLGPLSTAECDFAMDTTQALSTGTLPGIYSEPDERERKKTLRSYAATYLKEEIQAEALTRNIEGFARFLRVAAACAGSYLDLSKLASEAMVPRQTAVRFFEILEETLVVQRCDPFANSERRRLVQHPRYYFLDNGVLNALLGSFTPAADRIGILFEHLLHSQISALVIGRDAEVRVSSYRTEHGAEVDFILEGHGILWAVECKASRNVGPSDCRGLARFSEFYGKRHRSVVAYLGDAKRRISHVDVLPWQELMRELDGELGKA
ncbi:MAG: ATP-binding protein [Deltaproteobacteria bacterium]|nr:ATP-binding protein [Deltaproteobacteria bacterium]